jgi:hypothetical protein
MFPVFLFTRALAEHRPLVVQITHDDMMAALAAVEFSYNRSVIVARNDALRA